MSIMSTTTVALLLLFCFAVGAYTPDLGGTEAYAVVAASTVTNTGATVITGALAVSPGSAITGFNPPGTISGVQHLADPTSAAVQAATGVLHESLKSQPCDFNYTIVTELAGKTFKPGKYCFDTSALITGTATLDGEGNATALFIFQMGTTITTSTGARVSLTGSAQACGVWWVVGSSATFASTSDIKGHVIALASIAVQTSASVTGSLRSLTTAVTLQANAVTVTGSCGVSSSTPPTAPVVTNTTTGGAPNTGATLTPHIAILAIMAVLFTLL